MFSGKSATFCWHWKRRANWALSSVAFLGKGQVYDGVATVDFLVPSEVTARVQEAHLLLYHCLCELVDAALIRHLA